MIYTFPKMLLVSATVLAATHFCAATEDDQVQNYSDWVPKGCTNKMTESVFEDENDVQYFYRTCQCKGNGNTCNLRSQDQTEFMDRCAWCSEKVQGGFPSGNPTAYWHCGSGGSIGFRECKNGCVDNADGKTVTCNN